MINFKLGKLEYALKYVTSEFIIFILRTVHCPHACVYIIIIIYDKLYEQITCNPYIDVKAVIF